LLVGYLLSKHILNGDSGALTVRDFHHVQELLKSKVPLLLFDNLLLLRS
jgi:hypothetical protein